MYVYIYLERDREIKKSLPDGSVNLLELSDQMRQNKSIYYSWNVPNGCEYWLYDIMRKSLQFSFFLY